MDRLKLPEPRALRLRYSYVSPEHGIVDATYTLSPGHYGYDQAFKEAVMALAAYGVPIPYADDPGVDVEFP